MNRNLPSRKVKEDTGKRRLYNLDKKITGLPVTASHGLYKFFAKRVQITLVYT